MGVLPLQFPAGQSAASLGLTGRERYELTGIADGLQPGGLVNRARDRRRRTIEFQAVARIDTPEELVAFRHGGILPVRGAAAGCSQCSMHDANAAQCRMHHAECGWTYLAFCIFILHSDFPCCPPSPSSRRPAISGSTRVASRPPADLPELRFLGEWLGRGYAGTMSYLARSATRRADVRHVLPSARTVIATAINYNTDRPYSTECCRCAPRAHRQVRLGRRLSRCDDGTAGGARGLDARGVSRAVRGARVCRHRSRAGARLRAACRHRVDRKEHLRHQPAARIVDVPRRNHLQSAARRRRARLRPVRHVHAVPRGLPDTGARGPWRARCDSVRLLPDHRAARSHRRSRCTQASARTCTAATSVRKSVRGMPSRPPRAIPRGRPGPSGIEPTSKRLPR